MALPSFMAAAWESMYVIGPGTSGGWSLDDARAMSKNGEYGWSAVCALDNKEGQSFRIQESRDWDNKYHGPATNGALLTNGEFSDLIQTENCFTVPEKATYLIEAYSDNNVIKITSQDEIYLVGPGIPQPGEGWALENAVALKETGQGTNVWQTVCYLDNKDGKSFRLQLTKNSYDNYFGAANSGETIADNDTKTVSFGNENCFSVAAPGIYCVEADLNKNTVRLFRPANIYMVGVNGKWNVDNDWLAMGIGGDDWSLYSATVHLTHGLFKFCLDKSRGYDDNATLFRADRNLFKTDPDGDHRWETGADKDVAPGFIKVIVNAATKAVAFEEVAVWVEGLCAMKYDLATDSYITDDGDGNTSNPLHFLDGDKVKEYKFESSNGLIGTKTADRAGWYTVSVTFDDQTPVARLDYQVVTIMGGALCDEDADQCKQLTLGSEAVSGRVFMKSGVFLKGGESLTASIAGKCSDDVHVQSSGLYNVMVAPDENNAPVLSITGPVNVNMPLKEADFADGRAHYFLVGQRMGAWRLQPEWEFVRQDDGSYEIPARLLYNGYAMVGMVDNYQDYIYQTYKGFTHTDTNSKSVLDPSQAKTDKTVDFPLAAISAVGNNGCVDGKFTGTRYNDYKRTATPFQHGGFDGAAYRLINIYDTDGFGDIDHIKSMPSRVNSIRLTVDQWGNPSSLSFVGLNSDAAEVAKLRTFSLCGSRIRNLDIPYVAGVSTSPLNNRQPNDGMPAYGGREWAESWIQYETKDVPYVDGFGEYVYQTSFTRNWLGEHPAYFKFVKDGSGDAEGLEYTSNNITFTYREGLTHDRQFGQREFTDEFGLTHKEVLNTYSTLDPDGYETNQYAPQNLDDKMTVNPDDMVCYVVDDMWMIGDFKVWAGWGGSITNFEYDDNGTFYTRWYGSNASHGANGENRTAFYTPGEVQAYTLFRDVPAANFSVGYGDINTDKVDATGKIKDGAVPNRRFYKRVEIWYNLKTGFAYKGKDGNGLDQASFLVFYQEPRGPQISIDWANDNKNQINYTYGIQNASGTPIEMVDRTYGLITYYRIERYLLDEEGNMRSDEAVRAASSGNGTVVEERTLPEGQYLTSDAFAKTSVTDKEVLPAGRYRYKVTLKRTNTADHEFDALSNILAVTPTSTPSGVEAVNVAYAAGFAMTVVARDGMLHVNANAPIGKLAVYAVNGRLMSVSQVDGDAISIDISALPAGVYVANANNTSVRFIKR